MQSCVASLEVGRHGLAFASGLAAEDNVLRLLSPGDRVLLGNDAYGGTFRLIDKVHTALTWSAVDLIDIDGLIAEWPSDTKLVWLETPTNPLLRCFDIETICEIAHDRGALVCVDNTFATPLPATAVDARRRRRRAFGHQVPGWPQRCGRRLRRGRRRRVGGRADVHAERGRRGSGAVRLLSGAPWREDARRAHGTALRKCASDRRPVGRASVPSNASCTRNSPITPATAPRLSRCATSAEWSASRSAVVEKRRCESPRRPKLFVLAESLGAVESLIEHPGQMTHASVAGSPLEVPDNLLRLSVGIESAADLVADLEQALG